MSAKRSRHLYMDSKSPYWYYDFVVDGHRYNRSTKTASRSEARKIYERVRAEAIAGRGPQRKPEMTFDAAAGRWMQEHGLHLREADNLFSRLGQIAARLDPATPLSRLGAALSAWRSRRRTEVAPRTVNLELATIRRVYRYARDNFGVRVGDEPAWRRLMLPAAAPREWTLQEDSLQRLLEALPPDFRAVVLFAFWSGQRLTSVIRLRWADVDAGRALITFRDVKSVRPDELHRIPLDERGAAILASRNGQHPEFVFTWACRRRSTKRRPGERYAFSKDGWRKAWAKALAAAGIPDLHFHDLRHGAATEMMLATGNVAVVQQYLGHRSIATTRRYLTVLDRDLRAGMAARSRSFPGIETARAATLAVSSVDTTAYKGSEDDEQPAPKAGALPG